MPHATAWRRAGKHLLAFFVLGALIFGGKVVLARLTPAPRTALTVQVPEGAAAGERERRIDEAILVEHGIALGWLVSDPVVRRRMVQNLLFAAGRENASLPDAETEAALVDEAIALDMARSDPVIRRRLISGVERLLESGVELLEASDAELRAHIEAHPRTFERPAQVRFREVFLARQWRGDALELDARRTLDLLQGESAPDRIDELGDPLLIAVSGRLITLSELDRRYGAGFADQLAPLAVGAWQGPIASTFGMHLVQIQERVPAETLPFEEVRERALTHWRDAHREEMRRTGMEALRARYDVEVEVEVAASMPTSTTSTTSTTSNTPLPGTTSTEGEPP